MRVLVIEDYCPMRTAIAESLREAGYAVDETGNGNEGLRYAQANCYDIILLDLMLPGHSGLEILRQLREARNKVHILIMTARGTIEDKITGLDGGADDYLVKPFSLDELMARVRAMVRRKYDAKSPTQTLGNLVIDTVKKRVSQAGQPVDLSAREYAVLEYLIARQGQVVSRQAIVEHIYDGHADVTSNVIDVYIGNLRRKLETPGHARLIHTRRNLGYVFEVAAE